MRRSRWVAVAVGIVAVVAIAWFLRSRSGGARSAGGPGAAQAARPIPVIVAPASRRDVPIYLEGLGNVAAFQSVTVRTQVDGRLVSVQFQEGQLVKRGQVLAQIDPRPFDAQLHQAEGALARDEAQLKNAQVNVVRDKDLVAQKLIPQQQVDADVASVGQLEGAVRMDRAAIETARLNLDYARIVSPIDGVTGIRLVDAGNVVHPGDQNGLVVVTQLDPIAVIFTQPQDQLPAISKQFSRGPLQVEAFSRDGATVLGTGQLSAIDNQINASTATVRLKAVMPNPGRLLWPNQFVNARLRLETRKGALTIPSTAVQRGPSGVFVYVVAGDDTAAQRTIAIDSNQGDLAIVANGLADGERVVVEGQNQLRPGAKVAPRAQGQQGQPGQQAPQGTPRAQGDGAQGQQGGAQGQQGGAQGQDAAQQGGTRAQGRTGSPPVASDGADSSRPADGAR
jgi:membrane fusion protein, multidrug efflux system